MVVMQPTGYDSPISALLDVATCFGDFTIMDQDDCEKAPRLFLGDMDVGGTIDCCGPDGEPLLRIESTGENPAGGAPTSISKHGCIELVMGVRVTFLACFRTAKKSGVVVTDPESLSYSRVIQDARWRAIYAIRCCRKPGIKFVASTPIPTDGKCSGWQIDLQTNLSMCEPCTAPVPEAE